MIVRGGFITVAIQREFNAGTQARGVGVLILIYAF